MKKPNKAEPYLTVTRKGIVHIKQETPIKVSRKERVQFIEMKRKQGMKAIIDLQAFNGITETEEQAQAGWDAMSYSAKQTTMKAHRMCFPEKYENKTKGQTA